MNKELNKHQTLGGDEHLRVAELAYFKARLRGFMPGHEVEDWLLAERELLLHECSQSYTNSKEMK